MKAFVLILVVMTSPGFAFTLNNNFGAAFKSKNVGVYIEGTTSCLTNNITVTELEDLVGPAIEEYWNTVPTSSLRLSAGGFSGQIGTDISNARLCAPTDESCIQSAAAQGQEVIPPVSDIIIACNEEEDNFGNGVLAVTVPNNFSGRKIKGSVILINDRNASFGSLSRGDKIAVLAHEIGHAIGLGHAEDKSALMYYRTVNQRRSLGQDDIDGVSYLYPVHIDGCGLFGGTVLMKKDHDHDDDQKGPPFLQMGAVLLIMITMFEIIRLFIRPKARATA